MSCDCSAAIAAENRSSALNPAIKYLLRLVRHRLDWFQDELADHLLENRFISVHYSTICHELKSAGYSLKKLHLNGVKKSVPNLSIVWLSTLGSSWASSMRQEET